MRTPFIISAVLHLSVLVGAIVTLPDWETREFDVEEPVIVNLMPEELEVAETTNLKTALAKGNGKTTEEPEVPVKHTPTQAAQTPPPEPEVREQEKTSEAPKLPDIPEPPKVNENTPEPPKPDAVVAPELPKVPDAPTPVEKVEEKPAPKEEVRMTPEQLAMLKPQRKPKPPKKPETVREPKKENLTKTEVDKEFDKLFEDDDPLRDVVTPDNIVRTADKNMNAESLDAPDTTDPLSTDPQQVDEKLPFTISEIQALRSQLAQCWNMPAGAKDAANQVVAIQVEINEDKTVRSAKVVDKSRMSSDPYFRVVAESAVRAFYDPMCTPLLLPDDKYDTWKSMEVEFNPRKMLGL